MSSSDPIGKCLQHVDWWRHRWRPVTMTSRFHSLQSHRIQKLWINYPCWPFKHTLKENIVTEDELSNSLQMKRMYQCMLVIDDWLLVIDFVQSYNVFIELVVIVWLLLFWLCLSHSVILVVALQPTASTVSASLIQSLVVCGV